MPITLPKPTPPPVSAKSAVDEKLKASTEAAARSMTTRIEGRRLLGQIKTWDDVERTAGVPVPAMFREQPLLAGRTDYYKWFVSTAYERFRAAQESQRPTEPIVVTKQNLKFEKITLKPQQRKALDQLIANFKAGARGSWLIMKTGRGKTPVYGAFIEWLKLEGHIDPTENYLMPQVFCFTKKQVLLATRDKLNHFFGLRCSMDRAPLMQPHCHLANYQSLSSQKWRPFFGTETIEVFGNKKTIDVWRVREKIVLIVLDECHELKKMKSQKTRKIQAIIRAANARGMRVFFIFSSATPATVLDDTRLYNWATGRCDDDTETAFLQQFCRDEGPSAKCAANMERYLKSLELEVVRPPNDPLSYKIFNEVKLIDFPDEQSERMYREAEKNYVEAVVASGGVVGDLSMAQFQIFRHASELCKVPYFVERAIELVRQGRSPILALNFQDSVIKAAALFTKAGFRRDQLAFVWGGTKISQPSEVYTTVQMTKIVTMMQEEQQKFREEFGKEPPSIYYPLEGKELTKFKKTRIFNKDRLWQKETKAQQAERVGWLANMDLDKQTDESRYAEVNRFLADEAVICIMTAGAGGVGIDLDNQIEGGRPRSTLCSVQYYAEEWIQFLGRDNRLMTKSDVYHEIVMFNRSIESEHVLPRLSKRLDSMAAMTGGNADLEDKLNEAIAEVGLTEFSAKSGTSGTADDNVDDADLIDEDDDDDN